MKCLRRTNDYDNNELKIVGFEELVDFIDQKVCNYITLNKKTLEPKRPKLKFLNDISCLYKADS